MIDASYFDASQDSTNTSAGDLLQYTTSDAPFFSDSHSNHHECIINLTSNITMNLEAYGQD